VSEGQLDGSVGSVADFLLRNDGKLELGRIGEYLGGLEATNRGVCDALLRTLDFSGLPLDRALRRMISLIKLPGESQKIDRIIEAFAINWAAANPGAIDHVDTAQVTRTPTTHRPHTDGPHTVHTHTPAALASDA